MNNTTWTLEDAEVQFGDDALFSHCDIEVEIHQEFQFGRLQAEEYSGTITFPHPVPYEMFTGESGVPFQFDVTAETENKNLELDSLLVTSDVYEKKIDFAAMRGELVVDDLEDTKDVFESDGEIEARTTGLLSSLVADIANENVTIQQLNVENDTHWNDRTDEWEVASQKISVTYNED